MAQSIVLTSGSIFNGNPITFAVTPSTPTVPDASPSVISMHRIILEVECGISGGSYEVIKLSSPVITEGVAQTIDISSALRTFRDSYEYTPNAVTYPLVKFNIKAYDEYMVNGEIKTQMGPQWYPQNPADYPSNPDQCYLRTIFGGFSDIERITSGVTKGVATFSRKPTTLPQLVVNGETLAYTPAYSSEQQLLSSNSLSAPLSKVATIQKEGLQTLGYQSIYALPSSAAKDRQTFRFINSRGVLESISVQRATQKKRPFTFNEYTKAIQETFNSPSHSVVRKHPTPQSWRFSTDPLDEEWLEWYLEEFLMAEYVWMLAPLSSGDGSEIWLRVHVIPDEEYVFHDEEKNDILAIKFSARFDINGSLRF